MSETALSNVLSPIAPPIAPPASLPVIAALRPTAPLLVSSNYQIEIATRADDLKALFQLRRRVFDAEYGRAPARSDFSLRVAGQHLSSDGCDVDRFDAWCQQLIARDLSDGRIVGGYRVLLPDGARQAGGLYTEGEFDLSAIASLRDGLVEIGRACIANEHRNGVVLMLLWKALRRFVASRGGRHVIGCCSLPLADGGLAAAQLYQSLHESHGVPVMQRLQPRVPLPVATILRDAGARAEPVPALPPLLRGYLKAGGRIAGAPHVDREFGSVDLPILLAIQALDPRLAERLD